MVRSAITVSLVEDARGGPFVLWEPVPDAVTRAAALGYDAIEIFAPSADAVDVASVQSRLDDTGLRVAAVGTGAGWVKHKLCLTDESQTVRQGAVEFIQSIIDLGANFGAPAIIGSMQGRHGGGVDREMAMNYLQEGLNTLGRYAAERGVPLIYEPLNRYETNLCNTMASGVALLRSLETSNVTLLADLFHMNIEEVSIAEGLRDGGQYIGHVHFVDSNRRPAGCGHMRYEPIVAALRDIGYSGYLSAEAFPWPDSPAAAGADHPAIQRAVPAGLRSC
ncbi:MAG: sugar phosphate isomerase/epimerase family protein [Planctomycetaceae bacterium]